jgi:hypothetical protein
VKKNPSRIRFPFFPDATLACVFFRFRGAIAFFLVGMIRLFVTDLFISNRQDEMMCHVELHPMQVKGWEVLFAFVRKNRGTCQPIAQPPHRRILLLRMSMLCVCTTRQAPVCVLVFFLRSRTWSNKHGSCTCRCKRARTNSHEQVSFYIVCVWPRKDCSRRSSLHESKGERETDDDSHTTREIASCFCHTRTFYPLSLFLPRSLCSMCVSYSQAQCKTMMLDEQGRCAIHRSPFSFPLLSSLPLFLASPKLRSLHSPSLPFF